MLYNFDEIIPRKGTHSLKYDFAVQRGKPEDVLPLWVADMDFEVPKPVRDALISRCEHAIFGYTESGEAYFEALSQWFSKRFSWDIKEEWLVKTPGVVFALAAAVNAFTEPGDSVMIQRPVYYPFGQTVTGNDRRLVVNSLVYKNGKYEINFADFEAKIVENKVKLFILCSPHNPVGRVWRKEELKAMGDICLKHGVIIVSDEIHCDFVWDGHEHNIFATLGEAYAQNSVICTAPSKTFNIAGLQVSNIFIINPELRRKFKKAVYKTGYSEMNTLGLTACEAAYRHGEEWLQQLKAYLKDNISFARTFIKERLPKLHLVEPEGTYLIWIDFSSLGLTEEERQELVVQKAGLWLDNGEMFGPEEAGFERINVTCPRSVLKTALEKLEKAIKDSKL